MKNTANLSSKMAGRRVLVVGGSSGMGRALCSRLLEAGAHVAIAGRSRERLDLVAHESPANAWLSLHQTDVTDEAQVASLMSTIGPLDDVVCTAADIRGSYELLPDLQMEAVERAFRSKVFAPILLAKHAVPALTPRGSLTFTSGIAAYRPKARGTVVAAVNAALEGMVRALAVELAPLRVNAVSPGWVRSPIWKDVAGDRADGMLEAMAGVLPVGRVGRPDDIADAIMFLMSNTFTTGTVLHVEGGHRLV